MACEKDQGLGYAADGVAVRDPDPHIPILAEGHGFVKEADCVEAFSADEGQGWVADGVFNERQMGQRLSFNRD